MAIAGPVRVDRSSAARVAGPTDDLRSFVIFVRRDSADCGQRQVFVRVDGEQRLALAFGDAVEVEVRPGRHHFRIHNTLFWKHLHVGVESGERLECRIVNSARWWTAGVVGLLGAAPLFLSVELGSLDSPLPSNVAEPRTPRDRAFR